MHNIGGYLKQPAHLERAVQTVEEVQRKLGFFRFV